MTTGTEWDLQSVLNTIDQYKEMPGALLPMLHAIQDEQGFIPAAAVPLIAESLNLSAAEVHGVISFYHEFRNSKPGNHVLQVCQAESCQSMGSRQLTDYIKQQLKVGFHQTTPDGEFSLEPVYCLGNCACSPAIRLDDDIHGLMDEQKFDALVDEARTVALEVQ